jgi:chaperone required for assembly of F1-ATPase
MSAGWAARRFWSEARVAEEPAGYGVRLDDRPVRTPAKAPLTLPTRALAEAVASEWAAQSGVVVPATMPMTRMANSAIDKVTPQRDEVIGHLAGYGETDLLCYRADAPEDLVSRQAAAWDPWLDWLDDRYGVRLVTVAGVIPEPQDPGHIARLEAEIAKLTVFELAAFHDLVGLPGSLVLGLAIAFSDADPLTVWEQSRVDELWQIEQWGMDEEAERVNILKRQAFQDAARFFRSARDLG